LSRKAKKNRDERPLFSRGEKEKVVAEKSQKRGKKGSLIGGVQKAGGADRG